MSEQTYTRNSTRAEKRGWTYTLLLLLLGYVGAHRFYLRKIGTGITYLLTLSFLGIGVIVDSIRTARNMVRDAENASVQIDKRAQILMTIFTIVAIAAFFYVVVISGIALIALLLYLRN